MRRLLVLLSLALLLVPTVFSQKEEQPPADPKAQVIRPRGDLLSPNVLAFELNLTNDQKARVEKLWEEYQKRNSDLKQDTSITPEQRIQRLQQSRQEYINMVRQVGLDADQLKKFEEIAKSSTSQSDKNVDPRFQITPEQRQKLVEVSKRYSELRKNVMKDNTLDAQTKQRRLKEIETQMMTEIKGLLNPDQREQFEKKQEYLKQQQEKQKQPANNQGDKKEEKKEGDKPKDGGNG